MNDVDEDDYDVERKIGKKDRNIIQQNIAFDVVL